MASDSHTELIMESSEHSLHSSQREVLLEHLFTGEVMRGLWRAGVYDLVFETSSIVRHVQLKSTKRESKVSYVNVNLRLAAKPSGCVLIIKFDDELRLGPFYWFGAAPGERLPDITDIRSFKVAKQTRANSQGTKGERPNVRMVPLSKFQKLDKIEDVIECLFGTSFSEAPPGPIRLTTRRS